MPRVFVPDEFADDPSAYVWSHYATDIAGPAGAFVRAVYERSKLKLREVEAARMRTAQINGCNLCLGMRAARDVQGYLERSGGNPDLAVSARGDPVPDDAFYAEIANWRTWPGYSDRERLVIEYAERMGEAPKSIKHDDAFWEKLHTHFSDDEIVDMTFCIGAWMSMGRLTHVLDLDSVCMPTARADAA